MEKSDLFDASQSETAQTPEEAMERLGAAVALKVMEIKRSYDPVLWEVVIQSVSHDIMILPRQGAPTRFTATALIHYTSENKADPGF